MYIIIIGGDKVGFSLAKTLLNEGREVLIVEKNGAICEHITEELGSVCMQGNGYEIDVLADAGTERADMFIAVTEKDEDNLVACQVAKHRFNVPRTIASINDPQNELIFTKLGIDVTIDIAEIVLAHIQREVVSHTLTPLLSLKDRGLEIVEIRILPDSPVVGSRVGDVHLPSESILSLIMGSQKKPMVPVEDTVIEASDWVIAVVKTEDKEKLHAIFTGK